MQVNFSSKLEEAKKKYNLGKGEYFKPTEGANKIRLVSECIEHPGQYRGKPTFKWLCQVIDRKDGNLKPYFMPNKVFEGIIALQMDDDYSFTEVPMPYDININAKGAGTKSVVYSVLPGKEVPLTEEELKVIGEAPSIQELQKKVRENENNQEEEQPQEEGVEIDPGNIPF